jgi:hypothetical protein
MANQANRKPITGSRLSLSQIIRDPYVRAAFERAARDQGEMPGLVTTPKAPLPLIDADAIEPELEMAS